MKKFFKQILVSTMVFSLCFTQFAPGFTQVITAEANIVDSSELEIISQPETVSAVIKSTAFFRVEAVGSGDLTYRWQVKKGEDGTWANNSTYTGYDTDTISVPVSRSREGYQFRCVVKDSYNVSVTSEAAVLTVIDGVSITKDPENITAKVGETAVFHAEAVGDGVTYQWQTYRNGAWTAVDFGENADTADYSVKVKATYRGYKLRVLATDAYGNTARSNQAVLNVENGVVITKQPADINAVVDSTAVFTVEAEGEGDLTYQWQLKKVENNTWIGVPSFEGNNSSSLKVGALAIRDGYVFHCIVKDSYGNIAVSEEAALNIMPGVTITEDLTDVYAQLGKTAELSLSADGDGVVYQWEINRYDGNGWVALENNEDEQNKLHIVTDAAVEDNAYRCKAIDAYGNLAKSAEVHVYLKIGDVKEITVTSYGANGSDEINDDRNIQSALNFARNHSSKENPITVHVPSGTYYIARSMRIFSNTNLVLESGAKMVLTGGASIFLAVDDESIGMSYDNTENVTVSGGVWDGNAAESGLQTQFFAFKSAKDFVIKNAEFVNSSDHFLMLTGVSDFEVSGCSFKNMLALESEESTAYTKEAVHTDFLEIEDDILTTKNVTIKDCTFENVMSAIGTHNSTILDYKIDNIHVSGCTFSDIIYNCINAAGWSNGLVEDSEAVSCQNFLMTLGGSLTMKNNSAVCTGLYPVRIESGSDVQLINNEIKGTVEVNNEDGADTSISCAPIWISESNAGLSENTIISNSDLGVSVRQNSTADINGDIIIAQNGLGISVNESTLNIANAKINAKQGISVRTGICRIVGNTINAAEYAVNFYQTNGGIENNIITSAANSSVYITGTESNPSSVKIKKNTIDNAGTYDVYICSNTYDTEVQDNNLESAFDIYLDVWADVSLSNNGNGTGNASALDAPKVNAVYSDDTVILYWNAVDEAAYCSVFQVDLKSGKKSGLGKAYGTQYIVENPNSEEPKFGFLVLIYDSDGNSCIYTYPNNMVTVDKEAIPHITINKQPVSVDAIGGNEAVFSVETEDNNYGYLWQYCLPNSNKWSIASDFEGYTTDTLTVSSVKNIYDSYKFRCLIYNTETGAGVMSENAQLSVTSGISIIEQPQNAEGPLKSVRTFHVEAAGDGLTYQWQAKKSDSDDWARTTSYDGYNSDTLYVTVAAARDGYQFRCVIMDEYSTKVTSDSAKLTVVDGIKIIKQPNNVDAVLGSTALFSVEAVGEELTYQWQVKRPIDTDWVTTKSFTGYDTEAMQVGVVGGRNGYEYRCIIKDKYGNTAVSEAAVLNVVSGASVKIKSQPENVFAFEGTTSEFTVKTTGDGLTYQWQFKDSTAKDWTNAEELNGYDTDTLQVNAETAYDGYEFRCIVKDKYDNTEITEPAELTVLYVVKIEAQPESVSVARGATAEFTVEATGDGLTYQWQVKRAGDENWITTKAFTGYNTAAMQVGAVGGRNGYEYRCIIKDKYGNTTTSEAGKLTVFSGPMIVAQPENVSTVKGSTAEFTVEATGDRLTYQWQVKRAGNENWITTKAFTGYNTATMLVGAVGGRNGYEYRCIIKDKYGNTTTSEAAVLTVF